MKIEVKNRNGDLIEIIDRKPTTKIIGNFNPHWVRYHNHEYLVEGGVDYAYMHGENPEGILYYIVIN